MAGRRWESCPPRWKGNLGEDFSQFEIFGSIRFKSRRGYCNARMGSQQHSRDLKTGPTPYKDDIDASKLEYAQALDAQDPLRNFRDEFIIPSVKDLQRKKLAVEQGMYALHTIVYLKNLIDTGTLSISLTGSCRPQ